MSGLLSRYDGHLRNLNYACQDNPDASGGEAGDRVSLSIWNTDIGIHIHFQKASGIVTFEELNSVCLWTCQRDVISPVQMRRRPTALSSVSTGDWDIPSSCEMEDEPKFKPLQGNSAFFCIRATRGPFHLIQKTEGPSHIHIDAVKLHLSDCGKLAHLFSQRQGIICHLETVWSAWSFPRVAVLKLLFIYIWDGCLRESL